MNAAVRTEIEACLLRYTRGIDRLDAALVSSAFHEAAELEGYGRPGTMTIEAFVDYALPSLRKGYDATQHRLSNISIVGGDGAAGAERLLVESYVLAFHVRADPDRPDGPRQLLTFNGRYIDKFAEVNREWRIENRQLRVDWTRIETIDQGMPGDYINGARDQTDASYPL